MSDKTKKMKKRKAWAFPNPARLNRAVKTARQYLSDYPPDYDAVRDQLADRFEHAISVNELLDHLRSVLDAIDSEGGKK